MKRKTAAGLLGAAAVCALCIGLLHYIREEQAGTAYEALREEARTEASEPEAGQPAEEEAAEISITIPIDFAALQAENPDIYAWITIPGTAVDYPVVQRPEDNSYYLTHNVEGEEDAAGAIYTENYNSRDFTDPNTVLYGHNMRNGTMFRSLHNYRDRSFFEENREILIYTPESILHYEIYAAYLYDSRHLLLSIDFDDPEAFAQYLEEIRSIRDMNAFVDTEAEVTAEDRILTLSTCYQGMDDRRYLVQAVLVSIEKSFM